MNTLSGNAKQSGCYQRGLAFLACGLGCRTVAFCLMATVGLTPMMAQMVALETPFQNTSQSFYESNSVGWGYQNRNFNFRWPGGGAIPTIGGATPHAGANLGIDFRGPGGGGFNANLTMAQGSRSTRTSTTPMLVIPNGGTGFVGDAFLRPFVTGFVPVVNDGFVLPTISPLQQRIARLATEPTSDAAVKDAPPRRLETSEVSPRQPSSAEQADLSLKDIRKAQREQDSLELQRSRAEIQNMLSKAERYAATGKLASARYYYRLAWRRTEGAERESIEQRLRMLEGAKTERSP